MVKENGRSDLKIWHCRGCDEVHMTVGKRELISFDRDEFTGLARAVEELTWELRENGGRAFSVVDLAERGDPVH